MEKHKDILENVDTTDCFSEEATQYSNNFMKFFAKFKPDLSKDYELSNSACWEATRSTGGARGVVLDHVNDVYCDLYRTVVRSSVSSVLHRMVETSPGRVQELRGVRTPETTYLESLVSENPRAMVAAILEPLKVRLITKGPAVNYFLSKSYQKALFSYLRKFPQFELIGEPLREDHLYRMIDREASLAKKGMQFSHFVSGDYSAATDNLKITYTKSGLFASMQNCELSEAMHTALTTTLFEHEIHYPKKFAINPFMQGTGQLMGSPLSFPFLCTANLIAYKLSLEDYLQMPVNFDELPCLVNGDDILFRTNPEHYSYWKKRVASIGFDLSVGKNYIHETVLTINSTCYTFRKDRFSKVDFCNFGLLSGTSKLGGSRGEVRDKAVDLCDAYTRSVCGANNKPLAFSKFVTRNKEDISRITHRGRYNLFLPRVVGGLGLPIVDGIDYHVTRFQMCLAKLIKTTLDFNLVGFKSDLKGESVALRETFNSKKLYTGFGPLNQNEREFSTKIVTQVNGDYLSDTETKFFTKIGEKYDAKTLFPFKLGKEDLETDHHIDVFKLIVNYGEIPQRGTPMHGLLISRELDPLVYEELN